MDKLKRVAILKRVVIVLGVFSIVAGVSIAGTVLGIRGGIYSQQINAGPISVVTCYGDSLTAGDNPTTMCYEYYLRQELANVTVINNGHGGWVSKFIVDGTTEPIGSIIEPTLGIVVPFEGVIVLLCGSGDLNIQHPEWVASSIQSAIVKCGGRLLVLTLPPHPKFSLNAVQNVNAQIKCLCEFWGVPTCSLDGMLPEHFREDDLHFTAAGYEYVGKAVAASLRVFWQMACSAKTLDEDC